MLEIIPDWETVRQFIESLGWVKGMFALFFWVAHGVYYSMVRGRLKDRQREIDRIAAENHEYRNKFMRLLERELKLKSTKEKGK